MYAVGYHNNDSPQTTRLLRFIQQEEEANWNDEGSPISFVTFGIFISVADDGELRLADKIQDTQLNMKIEWIRNAFSTLVCPKYCMRHAYIKYSWVYDYTKNYSLFIWSSNLTECLIFLFAKVWQS